MKKLFTIVMGIVLAQFAFAQKASLPKAESMFKSNKLQQARDIIDLAVEYEKTKNNPKTYYLRGLIYAAIDTSGSPLSDNAREEAIASFNKSQEMNNSDKELYIFDAMGFPVTFSQHLNGYWTYYFNKAISAYDKGGDTDDEEEGAVYFGQAADFFEISQRIIPSDTNSYVYAAYAAQNAKQSERAAANFEKAIGAGAKSIDMFNYYAYILATDLKDNEGALTVTRKAKALYPNNKDLPKNEITYLIRLNKIQDAVNELESAVAAEPGNSGLWFTLGVMYDEMMDKSEKGSNERKDFRSKAINSYKKSIETDPSNYDAHFNYGVILFNEAQATLKEINNLGVSKEDQRKERELSPIMNNQLKEALPQWEKLYSMRPYERTIMETLQFIYVKLRMFDKAEKLAKEIDKLDK